MPRSRSKNKSLHAVFGDAHYPYVDPDCEKTVLQDAKLYRPAVIHLLGDIADCYAISRHRRDPERRSHLQDELNITTDFLKRLRKVAPDSRIIYTEGNHEERLRKYLCDVAPELQCLNALRMPMLLGLADLGIEWVPAHEPYRMADWWFVHGDVVRKHAGYSARAKAETVGANTIMGHTHRLAMVGVTNWSSSYFGVENGCLCSMSPDYIQGKPNWQQGYTFLHWDKHHNTFRPELVSINEFRAQRAA